MTALTPQELLPKCARVLDKSGKVFASRGMAVNDNKGTTQAFLQFNGTGAAKVKCGLTAGSQQIDVQHPLFGELDIGITQQYKHLG